MEKLKKLKAEHNHLFTDLLKATIFGLVMLAPLIAVASKCLYVTCNKNAKESYYGETINQSELNFVNSNDLVIGHEYTFISNIQFTENYNYTHYVAIQNLEMIEGAITTDGTPTYTQDEINRLYLYIRESNYYAYLTKDSNNLNNAYRIILNNGNTKFNYQFMGYQDNNDTLLKSYFNNNYIIEYNKYSYLDNAFYYAVNELGEQQLFSWTKNTAMYTTINTMTSGLDINGDNNTLAILLTYWALITIVYVIFDIVIQVFVKLTHFITE